MEHVLALPPHDRTLVPRHLAVGAAPVKHVAADPTRVVRCVPLPRRHNRPARGECDKKIIVINCVFIKIHDDDNNMYTSL